MKIRLEIEIPLTKEDVETLALKKGVTLPQLSKEGGYHRDTLWQLLNRTNGGQYSTLRKILLPIVDITPLVKAEIEKLFPRQ